MDDFGEGVLFKAMEIGAMSGMVYSNDGNGNSNDGSWKKERRKSWLGGERERKRKKGNESQRVEDDDSLVWRRSCDSTMPNSDLLGSY